MNSRRRPSVRAIRRANELVQQIAPSKAGSLSEKSGGRRAELCRSTATDAAGMSDYQLKATLRIASVPEAEDEAGAQSDEPPTVTELADCKPR